MTRLSIETDSRGLVNLSESTFDVADRKSTTNSILKAKYRKKT
jgi:hypothetical protein